MIGNEFERLEAFLAYSCCQKKAVAAGAYVDGEHWTMATNRCSHSGETCPRLNLETGERYDLCNSTHAEANLAKVLQGANIIDGIVWVFGHYYVCKQCADILKQAGVLEIRVREKFLF